MKDKLIILILGVVFFVSAVLLGQACNRELENPAPTSEKKKLNHSTSIYEVEFEGEKYIVVDTYRGIGICPKVYSPIVDPHHLWKSTGNDQRRFSEDWDQSLESGR